MAVPQWEGAQDLQETYLDAYVLRGLQRFSKGGYQPALRDFQSALDYPMERFGRSRIAQFLYVIGTAYEAMGDAQQAKAQYQKTLDANTGLISVTPSAHFNWCGFVQFVSVFFRRCRRRRSGG